MCELEKEILAFISSKLGQDPSVIVAIYMVTESLDKTIVALQISCNFQIAMPQAIACVIAPYKAYLCNKENFVLGEFTLYPGVITRGILKFNRLDKVDYVRIEDVLGHSNILRDMDIIGEQPLEEIMEISMKVPYILGDNQ